MKKVSLSRSEEKEIIEKIAKEGVDKLPEDKLRPLIQDGSSLALPVAEKYKDKENITKLARAGMEGWFEALNAYIQEYEKNKKHRFSTYSTWWIRKSIHELLGIPVE